jgi:hypothetical protein
MTDKTCVTCVFSMRTIEESPCKDCLTYDWWNNETERPYYVSGYRPVEEEEYVEHSTVVELDKVILLIEDLLRLANTLIDMIPDDIEFEEDDDDR